MRARSPDHLLTRLRPRAGGGRLTVDLRTLEWVPPAVLVAVAAQAHRAQRAGQALTVLAPAERDPAGYAARMGVGTVLTELQAEHDFPDVRGHDPSKHLIEVLPVTSGAAVDRLARLVYDKLEGLDRGLARALHGSVGEIAENVPDHAGTVGFLAAQTLPRRRELLIAIADAGVGIRSTLSRRGARSDEHAIELATRDSVSQYDEPDRGGGLPRALRLVAAQRGSLYIATGTASIRHFPRTRRYLAGAEPYQGTVVEARIPLD